MIPELTILLPTRNRPEDLKVCLESILVGFGPGQKVILGDNGEASVTTSVIADYRSLDIQHLINPSGSTYVRNLDTLFRSCQTCWVTVIHDDDFFSPEVGSVIAPLLKDPLTDFIFSDHWVCTADGTVNLGLSERYSKYYRRDKLNAGVQANAGLLAVNQYIALDGFFIRRDLAVSRCFDLSYAVASDVKWLIEVCDRSKNSIFLKNRLFAYRLSAVGLTSSSEPIRASIESLWAINSTKVVRLKTWLAMLPKRGRCLILIFRALSGKLKRLVIK